MTPLGKFIDLSTHNGSLTTNQFKKLKESGIQGAILRAGYGGEADQKDARFEQYYAAAKAAGMPVGAYHYSYAKTVARAKTELDCFLSWIADKEFELPLYFDIEDRSQQNLGKKLLTDMTVTFCEGLQRAGYYAGVYANKYWLTSLLDYDRLQPYTIWVAQYYETNTFTKSYDLWQYTSSGTVPGIAGRVDLNWCYRDFESEIKEKGLNGFAASTEPPAPPAEPPKAALPLPEKNNDGAYEYRLQQYGPAYPIAQHFKLREYASKDGVDLVLVHPEMIDLAQRIRLRIGEALISNSSYRSPAHNEAVGGVSNSQHLYGRAMDLVAAGRTPSFIAKQSEALGAKCTIIYAGFCHVDLRTDGTYYGYSSGTSVATNLVTLQNGARGAHVQDLQSALNDYDYALSVDGIFGTNTKDAVRQFQKQQKLDADGIVGKKTWAALLTTIPQNMNCYELTATLNVRTDAGISANAIAELPAGSTVWVQEIKEDSERKPWGNIGIGWISLAYTKKRTTLAET